MTELLAVIRDTPDPLVLPLYIELPTIFLAAVFGAHVFSKRGERALGVLVAGVIIGIGGGIMRDFLLDLLPAAVSTWYFIPIALAGAAIGGVLGARIPDDTYMIKVLRAIVPALLLIIGLEKAIEYQVPILPVIMIGLVTATGGTALCDLLSGGQPIKGQGPFYLTSLCAGAFTFVIAWNPNASAIAIALTIAVVVSLRILGVQRGWIVPYLPGQKIAPDNLT